MSDDHPTPQIAAELAAFPLGRAEEHLARALGYEDSLTLSRLLDPRVGDFTPRSGWTAQRGTAARGSGSTPRAALEALVLAELDEAARRRGRLDLAMQVASHALVFK